MAELSIRIDLGAGRRIGPGKIKLLEQIATHGSIAAGGRAMGMSYRRAWELVDEINGIFGEPVLEPRTGGKKGGGAILTPLGQTLISNYRAIEDAATDATSRQLKALTSKLPPLARKNT